MALTGSTNAEKIWNFCINKGLTPFGAAGLLGNIDAESALISTNLQDSFQRHLGYTDATYTASVDNGSYTKERFIRDESGYGICQWTYWTRKKSLYEFAKKTGRSIGDLEMQLEFLFSELKTSFPKVLKILESATSVKEASDVVLMEFECPYNAASQKAKRESFGQKYYTKFVTNKGGSSNMGYKYYTKGVPVKISEHFYSTEFDCHGSGCCSQTVVNERLPELLERIREHFKAPITITSPYRCQTHNTRIGGAAGSRHSRGDAADIVVKGVAPRIVAQYAESIGILGIGLYETDDDGYFVHIDTREYRSFWYGQSEQPRTTFGKYTQTSQVEQKEPVPNKQDTNNLNTILCFGNKGTAVKILQEKLIKLGYSCGVAGADGEYGYGTASAVRKFQHEHRLAVDGVAGHNTLTALDKAIQDLGGKAADSYVGKKIRVTASLLNVRSGGGLTFNIVKQLKYGATATVVDESSGWCKLDSPSGWVSKDYIRKI